MAHHSRDVDYKKDSVLCKTEFEIKKSLCLCTHLCAFVCICICVLEYSINPLRREKKKNPHQAFTS